MAKYQSKTKIVDAILYTSSNRDEILAFVGSKGHASFALSRPIVNIDTKEGIRPANEGDWVIKEDEYSFYPLGPLVFDDAFEKADDGSPLGEVSRVIVGKTTNETL